MMFRRKTRTYVPPPVPFIEPINDDYLASFGRSYADAKNRAEKGTATGDGEGSESGGGESSSSSSSHDGDDGDRDTVKEVGDGAEGGDDGQSAGKASGGADDGGGAGAGGGGGSATETAGGGEALRSPSGSSASGTASTPRSSLSAGRKKHGIFAANLPYELCNEEKLEGIFRKFGRVTAVVLSRPPEGRT